MVPRFLETVITFINKNIKLVHTWRNVNQHANDNKTAAKASAAWFTSWHNHLPARPRRPKQTMTSTDYYPGSQ